MRKGQTFFTFFLVCAFVLTASSGFAYEEGKVENGGSIEGKAVLTGQTPEPRVYHLVLFPNPDECAKVDTDANMNRVIHDFKTSENRGLEDVVVSIEHVDKGKPFNKEPVDIKAKHCKFTPYIQVVRQNEEVTVHNKDLLIHNSQIYQAEQGKILSNLPIWPEADTDARVRFSHGYKIFQLICGMHEFMQAWGYRVQNPYYEITDLDGNFKIDNIPPGKYVVNAWHPQMKIRSQTVEIKPGSKVNLTFEFDGDEVERPHYETIASGRIKKDAFKSREEVLEKEED